MCALFARNLFILSTCHSSGGTDEDDLAFSVPSDRFSDIGIRRVKRHRLPSFLCERVKCLSLHKRAVIGLFGPITSTAIESINKLNNKSVYGVGRSPSYRSTSLWVANWYVDSDQSFRVREFLAIGLFDHRIELL